jgi:ketosteroid isomerase-like protein
MGSRYLMALLGLAAACASAAGADSAAHCASDRLALRAMVEAEYAFAEKARASVRGAFLDNLAQDSWVLQPRPERGRDVYTAAKDSAAQLQWYPALAGIAASGDLGFSTGPWVYTATNGTQATGHFLTVWRRDADCRWSVVLDGGVENAASANDEAKLAPDQLAYSPFAPPPPRLIAADAPNHAVSDFQAGAEKAGFAAALRTYARNGDFRFYTDDRPPMDGVPAASNYLGAHPIAGAWNEVARGRAADSTLLYTVGELVDAHGQSTHSYVQIWQYDPKVANWGLRILLLAAIPQVKK